MRAGLTLAVTAALCAGCATPPGEPAVQEGAMRGAAVNTGPARLAAAEPASAAPPATAAAALATGAVPAASAPTVPPGAVATPAGAAVAAATGKTNATPASIAPPASAPASTGLVVEQFGVELRGVRLTANGYLVDVRYRVFDPARAHALLDRTIRPVLVDAATGNRFYVPTPPIVGALRQTARNKVIHTDRDYFMLFANPERKLEAGSKVVLYLGDERFADLRVEPQADHAAARNPVR